MAWLRKCSGVWLVGCAYLLACGDKAAESGGGSGSGSGSGSGTAGTQAGTQAGGLAGAAGDGGVNAGGSGAGTAAGMSAGEPLTGAVKIALGGHHVCAVLEDGHVWCWGHAANGELGNGKQEEAISYRAQQVPGVEGATSIASAAETTCVVLEGGGVVCWGLGTQLDFAGMSLEQLPTVVAGAQDAVDVRLTHFNGGLKACVLDRDGSVICWHPNTAIPIEPFICMNEVETLPSVGIALKRSGAAVAFSASAPSTECMLYDLPELQGATALSQGTGITGDGVCGILDGRVLCAPKVDLYGADAIAVTEVELPAKAVALDHSTSDRRCALLENDELWCWGGTALNILKMGAPRMELSGDIVDFAVAMDAGCAVMADTTVMCWGAHEQGQRGSDATRDDPPSLVLR